MEMKIGSAEGRTFSSSAQAELAALKERAAVLETRLSQEGIPQEHAPAAAAQQVVAEHWNGVLPVIPEAPTTSTQEGAITLKLSPERHDAKMGEIISVLQEKGVTGAIVAAESTRNPHIIDDFHRVLVEYVREGLPARGKEEKRYKTTLSMALFEVTLPRNVNKDDKPTDPARAMREFISLMEQFYRGMLQMNAKQGEYFSFEIANPAGASTTSIYVAVPKARKELFEKQILAIYPQARLVEQHDDYNAFADGAQTAAAIARVAERPIYSLRTFDSFPSDPLDVLLNSFTKLSHESEGAAVQFVISPQDKHMLKRFRSALQKIHEGVPIRKATKIHSGVAQVFYDLFFPLKPVDQDKRVPADDARVKNIEHKISSPLLFTDIRLVASAQTLERARGILEDIEGPFQQFADTAGNRLEFHEIPQTGIPKLAHAFSYRLLDMKTALLLSATELSTLAHLPRAGSTNAAPDLKQDSSHVAPAPSTLPQQGVLLGVNRFRGTETKAYIAAEDRLRHMYLIGQTGTGKSALLKNIVIQDIKAGSGVCFIDPHGTDVLDILSAIPPERMEDVIYFDPAHIERPMGLNMLEYDITRPEQKTLVVDELLGIFKKLFGAVPESMGPAFEQYFRNAALLVMEDPDSGNTLLDISRVFSDAPFRARKLAACKNPVVARFWGDIAQKASGEQGLENYAPYVTNKFDAFTSNEIVRPIISQQKSSFNFREIMDTKKILLVNLSKGRIGDLNANLLGLVIVGKFLIAALSRADSFGKDLPPFYLHIDEFQNFATPSIATIFSEARKYKLSLTVAHQFIAQLTDEIRDAVFGNVGSICSFRIGAADAEQLEKQFAPTFTASDLMHVDNYNAFLRLLVGGKPAEPFNIATLPFTSGSVDHVDHMREMSYQKYGRPRAEVEAEAMQLLVPSSQSPASLAEGGI